MKNLPAAFAAMGAYAQFILYHVKFCEKKEKLVKRPVSPITKKVHDAHDQDHWVKAEDAIRICATLSNEYGVGFVFTKEDPFFFLDIDNALVGGLWSPTAKHFINELDGAAIEVSSSGKGLHIFGTAAGTLHSCKNSTIDAELYTSGRFAALTGMHARGDSSLDCTGALRRVVTTYFPPTATAIDRKDTELTEEPVEEWSGIEDDDELIEKARNARSAAAAFKSKATFLDLWECNEDVLSKSYPSKNDKDGFDRSEADMALAQHLAFWTGNNETRIEKLMRESGLYREKYERTDYLPGTIKIATGRQKDVYSRKTPHPNTKSPSKLEGLPKPSLKLTNTLLNIEQQQAHFAGCVYICQTNTVYAPGGKLLDRKRFDVLYGGYSFVVNAENSKIVKSAWEAFTQSQCLDVPKVDVETFDPLKEPGAIFSLNGVSAVNTWWPVETKRKAGDPAPFLNHLAKVLPNAEDQRVLVGYLAALVQHQGVKFAWCPVLQGVEGNGKTLFTECVAYAIGDKYSCMPRANEISNKFNSWIDRRTFAGIEDIYVSGERTEVMECMKVLVTGKRQEVERKAVDQYYTNICVNFLINSNHPDAIRKTENDRRFAMFYTAQQHKSHLVRDGMTAGYFEKLYGWLQNEDGFAIVNNFLRTYDIPHKYNPAGGSRVSPHTSTTKDAIRNSMGRVEQEVIEAIESGEVGFRNGWVNSKALERLLGSIGALRAVPGRKRKELMELLGYAWHPNLTEGRSTRIVEGESTKPVLYIMQGHRDAEITDAAKIVEAYERSQK